MICLTSYPNVTKSQMLNTLRVSVCSLSGRIIMITANASTVGQKQTGDYETVFIDNGHLFGGPDWSGETALSQLLWSRHFRMPECLVMERWLTLFEDRIPRLLRQAKVKIPSEWYSGDINSVCTVLLQRLKSLRAIAVAGR
jgi:hypothetical protein